MCVSTRAVLVTSQEPEEVEPVAVATREEEETTVDDDISLAPVSLVGHSA